MLTKIEKKMLAKYKFVKVSDCSSAGFILSNGFIIATTNHAALCRTIGSNLSKVIRDNICRYLFRTGTEDGIIAFEYTNLTTQQKTTINLLLRADDFYTVITKKTIVSKFRPIRKIKF